MNNGKARWECLHEIKISRELHRWLHEIKIRKELDRWGEDMQSLHTTGIVKVSKSKLPVKIKSKTHGFHIIIRNPDCETCKFTKSCRNVYPVNVNKNCSYPFDLTHSDA